MNTETTQALSELAEINPRVELNGIRGDTLVSFIPMSDVSDSGQWVNRQERRLDEVRLGYTPFIENDVLFAKITPCMENGKGAHATGLKNGLGFGSTEFHVLRVRGDNEPRFLFHWLQARVTRNKAIAYMGGSAGQQRVQADFFSQCRIPRIDPREQNRIAAVLDGVDEAIAKTDAVIAKLKQVRAGLFHDLLTRGLDKNGGLRDPIAHPEQFQDSPLGRIPKEWKVATVEQLQLQIVDGDRGSNYPNESQLLEQGFCVFLNNKNIVDGRIEFSQAQFISEERDALLGKGELNLGDIVITTRGTVGNIAWFSDLEPYRHVRINSGMIILRDYEKDFVPKFLVLIWQHLFPSEYRRLSSGSAQPQFPIRDMQQFRLIVPKKDEQQRIVEVSTTLDRDSVCGSRALTKLHRLKAGLMNDLLTGRVRVPERIGMTI